MSTSKIKVISMKPSDYSKDFPFCPLMHYDPVIKMLHSEFIAEEFSINTNVKVIAD